MIEKIKGITIQGRCFFNDTSLILYPNTNDRISVIYGKNGSGKSTISMGFGNLASDTPVSDISLKLLGDNSSVLNSEEYKNNIFVFNEQYVDKNVKIDDDGLGTIILLGGQVDIQTDIDKHTELEAKRKSEWEKAQEKFAEYQTKGTPLSPDYHLEKIRGMLKKSGGWQETDARIKGNKQNSAVKDDVLFEICKLKPSDTIDNLKKKFDEKKDLLEKISDSSLSFPPLACDWIFFEDGLEEKVCKLLSQIIEQPVLTERENLILLAIQNGQQPMVEASKRTFADESTTYCPYCYQSVQVQYKQELIDSINRVLNKNVENHKSELEAISFPSLDEDYSKYESLNSELVKKINAQKEKCFALIETYKDQIKRKIGNTYTPNLMRRALEAFSTFNYRKGIEDVSCDKNVLNVLGERSTYFNNLMYRLVLHGESHYAERVYSLRDDTNFYEFVSDDEKKRTAKDILCFMYLLNPAHIQAYLQTISNAIENIKQWCSKIKDNSSFSVEVTTHSKKRKVHLYDFSLSAGKGNDIDNDVSYTEYFTNETDCDFALKVSGDSMKPNIPNDSIVLIKKCDCVDAGEIGAFYYDGEVYCKRLLCENGKSYLESINDKYEPIEIIPENTLKVYGKIIAVEELQE